jgi:hypothetical protein
MFLYFVKKVKRKLGKEGDKKEEGGLDKNKKDRIASLFTAAHEP